MPAKALDPDALPGGEGLLAWLVAPLPLDDFMDAVFDDRPLLVSRPDSPRYYGPWFSRAVIDDLLRHALLNMRTSQPGEVMCMKIRCKTTAAATQLQCRSATRC